MQLSDYNYCWQALSRVKRSEGGGGRVKYPFHTYRLNGKREEQSQEQREACTENHTHKHRKYATHQFDRFVCVCVCMHLVQYLDLLYLKSQCNKMSNTFVWMVERFVLALSTYDSTQLSIDLNICGINEIN